MQPTNATKAIVISAVNAVFALLTAFDIALTEDQQSAIIGAANVALLIYVALTYKNSPKRVED